MVFERDARKVVLEDDACVVDQDLDRDARPFERLDHRFRRAGDAEVDRHPFRLDSVSRSELQRERRQRLLVAGLSSASCASSPCGKWEATTVRNILARRIHE